MVAVNWVKGLSSTVSLNPAGAVGLAAVGTWEKPTAKQHKTENAATATATWGLTSGVTSFSLCRDVWVLLIHFCFY